MISFSEKNRAFRALTDDIKAEYKKQSAEIRKVLPSTCPDKILLGERLIALWKSNAYSYKAVDVSNEFVGALKTNCHSKVFFLVCEKEFALDKSQVSRYMNIVDEYCSLVTDPAGDYMALKDEWKEFSYSQLSEMLSLKPEQRKEVNKAWSVKRIREYKKSLRCVATSQRKKDDFEVPEQYQGLKCRDLIEILISRDEERFKIATALEKRGLTITELLQEEEENDEKPDM